MTGGATAGPVAGVPCGAAAIPPRRPEPPRDRVRGAVYGFGGASIRQLAERALRLATLAR
ncbi:hypothetical protein ACH4MA_11865 [Streptomyces roseolus]|uniref:hypothetical protein n=1 Tax=Streptomyces roseolus TaxID=67358 RepID=UPI0037A40F3B